MGLKFRRGTTAQKSGSLAFGEPYVNTDLQTLQIGTNLGDVTLASTSTSSVFQGLGVEVTQYVSGSTLGITGNATIGGNLTVGGQLTIGDQTSDTVNVVASLSSSLIPQTTNAFDLGSASKIWRDLYISTGSIKFVAGTTVVKTLDLATLTALEAATGSSNTSITNLNSTTASLNTSVSNLNSFTSSANTRLSNLETKSASVDTSVSNLNTTSASVNTSVAALNIWSASAKIELSNLESKSASVDTSVAALNTFSSSQLTQNSSLATITGSLITSASTLTQRVAAVEAVSGTFARTNSANTFNGTQTVSGSLYVTQDLVVGGSSSIQNISSSNLIIGAAYVTLNTNTPSSRYAGINFIDSGSNGGSGSLWYDAEQDEYIQIHKGNGTNITSSHFVQGPQTYDNLGNELYLTNNRLVKGTGLEHIVDSTISDDGTTVSIANNIDITGSIKAPQLNAIATITGSLISSASADRISITNINTTTASLNTSVAALNTFSSSELSRAATLGTYTGSIEGRFTTLATLTGSYDGRFTTLATTTGSLQTSVSNLNTTTASLNTSVSNINTTTASLNTSVSNINTFTASMSTASNVRFGSLGIGMAASGTSGRIDAANDIVAFSTSDIRLKENITPIPNAIDKIKKISGNTYDWKVELKDVHGYEGNDVGVIAQEVEAVLPQLVQDRDNGYKAVKYDKIVALLIEGIKEQQQHIDNLTIQVEELKKQKGL
jgi:ABC-type transporter Mla subunit MlaD